MTLPVDTSPLGKGSADVYTDFAGLTALKKGAHANDPAAIRQVAKQYESLFARMMIKSMREAVGKDPMFGSDEEQSYQEMYDDQLSLELTKGKGLGLADMLVRQMQRLSGGDKTDPTQADAKSAAHASAAHGQPAVSAAQQVDSKAALRLFLESSGSGRGQAAVGVSADTQANFITEVWPAAQQAAQQLGVDPRNLIAQAALETNWGTRVPRDSSGRSSNNLFGLKTGSQWGADSVTAGTHEYQDGNAVSTTGQFRAYDSKAQSFQDYVSLLRGSPRYAAALNTGNDAHAFASALQRGGYATDPDYAGKIAAIAGGMGPLKSASNQPLTPNTGIL